MPRGRRRSQMKRRHLLEGSRHHDPSWYSTGGSRLQSRVDQRTKYAIDDEGLPSQAKNELSTDDPLFSWSPYFGRNRKNIGKFLTGIKNRDSSPAISIIESHELNQAQEDEWERIKQRKKEEQRRRKEMEREERRRTRGLGKKKKNRKRKRKEKLSKEEREERRRNRRKKGKQRRKKVEEEENLVDLTDDDHEEFAIHQVSEEIQIGSTAPMKTIVCEEEKMEREKKTEAGELLTENL
ncbi:unnamed protein product, partial [Cyprideis torosa]